MQEPIRAREAVLAVKLARLRDEDVIHGPEFVQVTRLAAVDAHGPEGVALGFMPTAYQAPHTGEDGARPDGGSESRARH